MSFGLILCLLSFSLLLIYESYESNKRGAVMEKIKDDVDFYLGQKLKIPSVSLPFINGNCDTLEMKNKKYKVLLFLDSNQCTPCRFQAESWKYLIERYEKMEKNISFLFFVAKKKDNEKFIQNIIFLNFKYPIYELSPFDRDSISPLICRNKNINVFLVDKNNAIIAVGNPIENSEVLKLYDDLIK